MTVEKSEAWVSNGSNGVKAQRKSFLRKMDGFLEEIKAKML
jgi:hypothetical protein